MVFLSLQFLLRYFYNHHLFDCKCIPHAKYEKKNPHWKTSFFVFLHNIRPNLAQIFPKDHTNFAFFVWFPMKYVRGTININNLCCNPAVLEKLIKLKNCFLDPICTEKGSLWVTPKMEKNFFGRTNKSRSSAFRKFSFYQNIICFVLVGSFSILSYVFCQKSVISS